MYLPTQTGFILPGHFAALRSYVELVRMGKTAGYLDTLTEQANALEQHFDALQDFSRGGVWDFSRRVYLPE